MPLFSEGIASIIDSSRMEVICSQGRKRSNIPSKRIEVILVFRADKSNSIHGRETTHSIGGDRRTHLQNGQKTWRG